MASKSKLIAALLVSIAFPVASGVAETDQTTRPVSLTAVDTVQANPGALRLDPVMDARPHHGPPTGVPPALHRKVLRLYKRLHNAYPDASRKRIFIKIAEVLEVNPRRLWNLYHPSDRPKDGPPIIDVRPIDAVSDRRLTDRSRDRIRDRVTDRPHRDSARDRMRDRPVIRDRVRRDRPVRPRTRGG